MYSNRNAREQVIHAIYDVGRSNSGDPVVLPNSTSVSCKKICFHNKFASFGRQVSVIVAHPREKARFCDLRCANSFASWMCRLQ